MNLNDEEGPRFARSPREGFVLVSLYSWTCVTVGVILARLAIGILRKVGFESDDGTALAGSIVYLGATVSWQFAASAGLGRHFADLSAAEIERYFKAAYAAQLLQIAAMALAKMSCIHLLQRVCPQTRKQKIFLFSMVAFWFVYSVLAFAFQCGFPRPWEVRRGKCAKGGPLISAIALNMLSDIVLAGWIMPVLRTLKMEEEKRRTAAILFGIRIVVPIAAGLQAWKVAEPINSADPTWDSVGFTFLNQTVTSLSLILASLPRIKRFLGEGGTGMLDPRIRDAEMAPSIRGIKIGKSRIPLKLVPSGSGKFTTTVESKGSSSKTVKEKHKEPDWQKFVSMGSHSDEHTSTSSLFEQQGVMRHQEVTVQVERKTRPTTERSVDISVEHRDGR